MLFAPLALSSLLVVITLVIHLFGLMGLMRVMRARARDLRPMESAAGQTLMVLLVVLGLFAIHTVQIWLYAIVYDALGVVPTFEAALYYSICSFTTVGYGDVVLDADWRLMGAIESANGFLLLGWSTAFLISVVSRLRSIEFDWLERREGE